MDKEAACELGWCICAFICVIPCVLGVIPCVLGGAQQGGMTDEGQEL